MHQQKILKVGNSLAVTLPSKMVKTIGLKAGDKVITHQQDETSITYKFLNPQQLSLNQLAKKK